MRTALALLLAASTISAQQPSQPPVHVEPQLYVTAIEVIADVRNPAGQLPAGLTPADFILLEEGVEKKIIGVDYLRTERASATASTSTSAPASSGRAVKPWQTVLYFETDLSNGRGRRQTVKELSKHIDKLVQMGTVDVIFANPKPAALLKNSRDPEAVRQALNTVATGGGVNQIALHRNDFLKHVRTSTELEAIKTTAPERLVMGANGQIIKETGPPDKSNFSPRVTAVDPKVVKPYIEQEVQLINRFRRNLISWMSNYGRYAPRTLIMVTDGFDLDPLEYYSAHMNKADDMDLRGYVTQAGLTETATKMARSLASAGWTTVSVQGDTYSDGWMDDTATSGVGRVHKFNASAPSTGARSIFYRPAEPLRVVAEETGGDVLANSGKIADAIERLDDRLRITYQVDRKPDGKPLKVELRARDKNLKVRSARWAASSTPDEMAEQRALTQLHEAGFTGDLQVDANVEWTPNATRKQGNLRVVSKIPNALAKADFRFTLAVLVPPKDAFVTTRPLPGYQLTNGEFRLRTPLDLPAGTTVVVIAIEDVATGMWGSARIQVP